MTKSIWQYSIGGLLVLTAVVAGVVAFTARYPAIAFLIAFGMSYLMIESPLFRIKRKEITKASAYAQHPFLVAGASLLAGGTYIAIAASAGYGLWSRNGSNRYALIPIVLFTGLAIFCLRPLWLLIHHPPVEIDKLPEDD